MQVLLLKYAERILILKKTLRIFIKRLVYRFGKVGRLFQEKSKWSTWVYRVTLNVCLTLAKKNNKRGYRQEITNEASEDNKAFENENLNTLYEAIKKLSEVDRAIILLHLDENPHKEIATIIGTSANNIAVRINRIKKQLKTLLHGKIN